MIVEEINRSGGNSGDFHGQMHNMNTQVRHGSEAQRQTYLPKIAAECMTDGYWFTDRETTYVSKREVFGRPVGQNQGVQFPIAEAFIEVKAANACLQFHGGFGFAREYDAEQKFRETGLCQVAPISNNLILS